MKELALFVEGQTELIFVTKLIVEIVGAEKVFIEGGMMTGGKKFPRFFVIHSRSEVSEKAKFYVTVYERQAQAPLLSGSPVDCGA